MQPEQGDIVRSFDPFKLGEERQRPWLIVNNSSHPFGDEQFLAVAISTKEYEDSLALRSEVWDTGGIPRESFVSPWAIHSPRIEFLAPIKRISILVRVGYRNSRRIPAPSGAG